METIFALIVGSVFGLGVYLLLQRNLMRVLFGVIMITNAVNLLIFTVGRLTRGEPPVVPEDGGAIAASMANPLPQALILTAIVISFGLAAFMLALVYRSEKTFKTLDSDQMSITDHLEEPAS